MRGRSGCTLLFQSRKVFLSLARLRAPAKCSLDQRNPNEKPPPSERTAFYERRDWIFFFSFARPFLISRCDPMVYWWVSDQADFQICGEPESQICRFILALGFAFDSLRNEGWLRNSVNIGLMHLS